MLLPALPMAWPVAMCRLPATSCIMFMFMYTYICITCTLHYITCTLRPFFPSRPEQRVCDSACPRRCQAQPHAASSHSTAQHSTESSVSPVLLREDLLTRALRSRAPPLRCENVELFQKQLSVPAVMSVMYHEHCDVMHACGARRTTTKPLVAVSPLSPLLRCCPAVRPAVSLCGCGPRAACRVQQNRRTWGIAGIPPGGIGPTTPRLETR